MTIKTSTLRPGLLVSLKSSVSGNMTYRRRDLESKRNKDGSVQTKWETERVVTDQAEHDAAFIARSTARSTIARICANSAFGLLCPESDADALETAIADARKIADEFNATAKLSRVSLYVITGRIAPDDVEAVRAINSEIRDLLADMETGLKNLDVKAVREAASKAKNIGAMLTPDAQSRIQLAIDAARGAARQMVKAGDQVAFEIDKRTIRTITEQRTAFLDLDPVKEIATPKSDARAVDFDPMLKALPSGARAASVSKKSRVDLDME
jgi:ElaB/YqjD/DUF883 family membrane-anchored ribosome-binding protein